MSKESSSSGGIGITGALTLIFIVLKLVPGNPVNDWSWWWVLSPIWISAGLFVAAILIGLIVYLFVKLVMWLGKRE